MYYIIINGEEILTRDALYDFFEKHMDTPDYFGRNLDALHDFLTDCKVTVKVINTESLKANLGHYADAFLRMLNDSAEVE